MGSLLLVIAAAPPTGASPAQSDPSGALAGIPADKPTDDPLDWALVPYVAGSTDAGVAFGLIWVLADLEKGYDPYRWRLRARFMMSIRDGPEGVDTPEHNDGLQLDLPARTGDRLRLTVAASFQRWATAGYFGIGNATRREPDAVVEEAESAPGGEHGRRYQHTRAEAWARINARFDIGRDWALRAGFQLRYVVPDAYGGSLFGEQARASRQGVPGATRLRGTTEHVIGQLALGVLYDSRDDEIAPTRGMFHEVAVRVAPGGLTGNRMTFAGITVNARFYQSIYRDWLVFAGRAFADLLFGAVPYHEMSSGGAFERMHMLAGPEGVRGPPIGRYYGRAKVLSNVELRSMLYAFDVGDQHFRLGLTAFFDAGRVWAVYEHAPELDGTGLGLKWGVGLGPRLQWGETVLLRLDVAYSPDAADLDSDTPVGVYAGLAHAF